MLATGPGYLLLADLYCMSYLKDDTVIPWPLLMAQFGSDYNRGWAFKGTFTDSLKKVMTVYPRAKVEPTTQGLQFKPSKPHIIR
jgi:hypothetical protein